MPLFVHCSRCGHLVGKHRRVNRGMPNPLLFSWTYATCIATWMELGGPGPALLSRCGRLHNFLYKGETGSKLIARCGHWKRTHAASEEHKAALADPMAAHTSASIAKQWGFSLRQGAVQNCESFTQGLFVCTSACARATLEGLLWVSGGKGQSGEFPPLWPFVTSGF